MRPLKVNGKQIHAVIGGDARFVRPLMPYNNQPAHPFTAHLSTVMRADTRAVRPYMHSSRSLSPPFYALIRLMWVCRDARLVRPFKVNGKQIHAVIGADARAVCPYIQLN